MIYLQADVKYDEWYMYIYHMGEILLGSPYIIDYLNEI